MSTSELIIRLVIAVALSGALGLERELRQKHAGLRTHALVGLGAALIVEVSAHGFDEVLVPGRIELDPSRVAAQVVSGIGFIGAGLIFVRQEYVRGLTTAASIWLTAAVGLAAGAGMWEVAVAGTVLGLVVVEGLDFFERVLHFEEDPPRTNVKVTYVESGAVAIQQIVAACEQASKGKVGNVEVRRRDAEPSTIDASFEIHGGGRSRPRVVEALLALEGVTEVSVAER
jgi:putative Mg2+ transporter-C (MgtC) family protein